MRIGERGQITIPQELRERYGLLPHTEVHFVEWEGKLVLVKDPQARRQRLHTLYGQVKSDLSTDEIMALLRD